MTKRKRYAISAAVLMACVCVAMGVLAMMPPRPGVTKANFDRIEKGMTFDEVAVIFGESPSFDSGPAENRFVDWCRGEHAVARVAFVRNVTTDLQWFEDESDTILAKLRRWFGLAE